MKTISALVLATAASALTACGGDGGNDPSRPIDPAPLRITSSNQNTVARAALSSGFAVARTSTISAADRASAQSAGRAGVGSAAGALDSAVRAALTPWLAQRRTVQSVGAHPAGAVAAPAEACANGGTRSATFDDRDNNAATSAGDIVTVSFAACSFNQVVLDGTMVVTVIAASGGSSLSGAMQFQQVKVTSGSMKTTIAGTADVTETDDGSHTDTAIVVGAAGLSIAVSSPSYSDTIALANTFTIDTSADDSGEGATVRIDGTFSPSSLPTLDGSLHVDTVAPLALSAASAYPSSGQVRVTDDFGAVLLLTVTDATKVALQLDADGNDTFEADTSVAWSALLPH